MKKILIVDDEEDFVETMEFNLTNKKFAITTANNSRDAYKKLEKEKPDLILLDIMMPGMDGLETCRHLKSSEFYGDIPIIILSSKGQSEDIEKGLAVGANDYVVKPFDFDELILRIEKLLSDDKNSPKTSRWFITKK